MVEKSKSYDIILGVVVCAYFKHELFTDTPENRSMGSDAPHACIPYDGHIRARCRLLVAAVVLGMCDNYFGLLKKI